MRQKKKINNFFPLDYLEEKMDSTVQTYDIVSEVSETLDDIIQRIEVSEVLDDIIQRIEVSEVLDDIIQRIEK